MVLIFMKNLYQDAQGFLAMKEFINRITSFTGGASDEDDVHKCSQLFDISVVTLLGILYPLYLFISNIVMNRHLKRR